MLNKKTDHFIGGKSFNIQLSPGYRLINELYFITRVIHLCSSKNSKEVLINAFYYNCFRSHHLNSYQALPKTQLIIKGHQCAKVASSNKKLFSIDNRSRISIIFSWDSNKTLVRAFLVQGQAGNQYGHQWLPREGEEVLVMFYDGDPSPCDILIDKIITGAPKILFEGMPVARINDSMQHGGKIISGSNTVQIGSVETISSYSNKKQSKKMRVFI